MEFDMEEISAKPNQVIQFLENRDSNDNNIIVVNVEKTSTSHENNNLNDNAPSKIMTITKNNYEVDNSITSELNAVTNTSEIDIDNVSRKESTNVVIKEQLRKDEIIVEKSENTENMSETEKNINNMSENNTQTQDQVKKYQTNTRYFHSKDNYSNDNTYETSSSLKASKYRGQCGRTSNVTKNFNFRLNQNKYYRPTYNRGNMNNQSRQSLHPYGNSNSRISSQFDCPNSLTSRIVSPPPCSDDFIPLITSHSFHSACHRYRHARNYQNNVFSLNSQHPRFQYFKNTSKGHFFSFSKPSTLNSKPISQAPSFESNEKYSPPKTSSNSDTQNNVNKSREKKEVLEKTLVKEHGPASKIRKVLDKKLSDNEIKKEDNELMVTSDVDNEEDVIDDLTSKNLESDTLRDCSVTFNILKPMKTSEINKLLEKYGIIKEFKWTDNSFQIACVTYLNRKIALQVYQKFQKNESPE
ncbi:putative uncharacterized protein DDB_G0282133 [Adelges cooleyi]|uniref:putative uncharacterized protein DDB_G0282133 n=1 Tax=Adelges cooleyi TaxID=133065 RepID=UPI0021803107|nr:putative uncharacterized protein DDB_G0282133 [Adelges cooleyi]XP_050428572.1 putative uncharacterized protein DDB_G0282133 [Adelges cooleyi]